MSAIDTFLAFKEDHPWVVILTFAFVAYTVIDHIQVIYLRKKLGAKPFRVFGTDYTGGFRLAYAVLTAKKNGQMVDYTLERYKDLPNLETTFHFKMLGKYVIATREPENIKAILATQFNDFCLGTRHRQFLPLLGDGIFTLDGEGWKHSRAMLRPQFAREQVAHVKVLEPHLQTLGQHIRKHKGKKFDIQELFFRLTVDSATEFLFGESVYSLQDASIGYDKPVSFDGKAEFAEAFNVAQSYLATRSVVQDFYFLINPQKFKDAVKNVHKFADYYVQKALDSSPEELEKYSDDTYNYVFLYELAKQTRNPKVLRDQLLNILVAGRDTTAGLLSFIFFELARNPGTWAKLKEEIYEKFGSGENARVEDISFESLKKCEYLKAIVNECLRLYPSVPINFRVAQRNTTLPRGGGKDGLSPVLIRKGQTILYSVYCTHRDKLVYGEDAEEFRPERWFEPSTKKLGWSFLPFNGGPRICLGQQFALTEASYIVARLAQMFPNIESHSDETIPKKQSHLTMSLDKGCQISLY